MWLLINIHWRGNGPNVMQITCKATCKLEPLYEVNRWGTMHIKSTGQELRKPLKRPVILAGDLPFPKESDGQRESLAIKECHQAWSRDGEARTEGNRDGDSLLPCSPHPFQSCTENKFPFIAFPYRSDLILAGQIHLVTGRPSDLLVHSPRYSGWLRQAFQQKSRGPWDSPWGWSLWTRWHHRQDFYKLLYPPENSLPVSGVRSRACAFGTDLLASAERPQVQRRAQRLSETGFST